MNVPARPTQSHIYRARCTRVVDGDTIDCVLDVGFNASLKVRVRLLGVNTPEVRGKSRPQGLEAKEYVEEWVKSSEGVEWPLLVQTKKGDAFGRWLAWVWSFGAVSLNEMLLRDGQAVEFDG